SFKLHKAGPALAGFNLSNDRRFFAPKHINIDVVPAIAEAGSAAERVTLSMHAQRLMAFNQLSLAAIALATVTRSAHVAVPLDAMVVAPAKTPPAKASGALPLNPHRARSIPAGPLSTRRL